jgi:hypothetical protein
VGVGVALDCAQYLPPVFKLLPESSCPPQTIISLPVHTAVVNNRPVGAPVVLVAVQLLVPGLYLPPVFKKTPPSLAPPQTIISLPVHTAFGLNRLAGALVRLVADQMLVPGLYLPPVLK